MLKPVRIFQRTFFQKEYRRNIFLAYRREVKNWPSSNLDDASDSLICDTFLFLKNLKSEIDSSEIENVYRDEQKESYLNTYLFVDIKKDDIVCSLQCFCNIYIMQCIQISSPLVYKQHFLFKFLSVFTQLVLTK